MHGLCGFWLRGIASNDPGYHYRAVSASTFCAVTAACLVVRREVWDCVSGLDEINLKVAFNDVDFCLKVQALGLRNIVEPHAIAIHHESASRGADAENREKQVRCHTEASVMHARWGELIVADPTYSPNLSLGSEKIRLAFPPRIKARWQDEWYRRSGFTSAGRKEDLNMYGLDSNLVRAREIQHLAHGEHGSLVTPSTNLLKGLTIIILTKNRPDLIVPLLKQLKEQSHSFANQDLQFEILLGDTGSNDPEVLGFYEEFFNPSHWPGTQVRARCIRELRYHFSQNNNQLAALASGQSLLFMNNDIILPEDPRTLLKVFDTLLSDPTIGCLGAVLLYPDGKVQHAGCGFLKDADRRGMPYHLFHHQQQSIESFQATSRCGSVTGAFLAIQTDRFLLVGGFDEQYAAEAQDVALCLAQNRLGHASVCGNFGAIQHLENATRPKGEENLRDRQRLLRQFGSYIEATFL